MTKKKKLFDEDSEEEVTLKTENEYAKKYDTWREKEELYKLEQKYGSKALNSDGSASSDSEDESDEPPEVSEEVEKQFLKTLSLLKTKDPRIYDPNYKFFDEQVDKEKEKEPETKKVTFGDSDDDEDDDENIFSIEKKAEINEADDEPEKPKDNASKSDLKAYLKGAVEHVDDEAELAPLRALWSDPHLNEGEAFLRDYILNKKYLEEGPADIEQLRDDEELEEDEKRVEEQGQFERAYNFRYEEPDHEFLKRFPRTMNAIRPKDTSRAKKRAEVKERKEREKKSKMEEIARMKDLKMKDIKEKIKKIKEVTGNTELAFRDEDIEGDFDPEEHDQRMKALFDDEYYGEEDEQKPVFPDLDEELEIENWDKYEKEHIPESQEAADAPHCEDEDFNMDADYDPKQARENLLEELTRNMGKKRRNRKKKTKLSQLLAEEKPTFIPEVDKTYSEYMEEYYKMDCEDVIGDLPTRFKYRQVVPNSYGLTVEEILLADDKELTQWVPLKKIVKYRPENVEKSEVNTYTQKAADVRLKKKLLPSLFKELPEEPEIAVPIEQTKKKKKKKKQKEKQTNNDDGEVNNDVSNVTENVDNEDTIAEDDVNGTDAIKINKKKKKKKKREGESDELVANSYHDESNEATVNDQEDDTRQAVHLNKINKKKKKKKSIISDTENESVINNEDIVKSHSAVVTENHEDSANKESDSLKMTSKQDQFNGTDVTISQKKKKKKQKLDSISTENSKEMPSRSGELQSKNKNLKRKLEASHEVPAKKKNKNKNKSKQNNVDNKKIQKGKTNDNSNPLGKLSDERLKAYGLNPKKYRSFLKYKKF